MRRPPPVVKLDPTDDLSIQLGRFTLPTFLISDSRRVGYANTWVRPADEVYGLALLDSPAAGGKASYRVKIAGASSSGVTCAPVDGAVTTFSAAIDFVF